MTAPTKTINGVEAVGYMGANDCLILRDGKQVECLEYSNDKCRCPGAVSGSIHNDGIWIEKQKYLELRLLGELP